MTWDLSQDERGGYPHFMLKEIHEQPKVIRDTLIGRISEDGTAVNLPEIGLTPEQVRDLRQVAVAACGTASHAGLVGKYLIEKLARIPVEWDVASEFCYRDPLVDENTLVLAISQSGETADTLAALREAKRRGAKVLAITNVRDSTIAKEADWNIYTVAGPEISIASTKAYGAQLTLVILLALWLGQHKGLLKQEEARELIAGLTNLPAQAAAVLKDVEASMKEVAEEVAEAESVYFVGRNLDYAVAKEGQLKLKETSYIHAEAYPTGELKHGPLALITDGMPVVALNTQPDVAEKSLSNIQEMKARGARVIGVALEADEEMAQHCHKVFYLPSTHKYLTPVLSVLPLQLLAYYTATARGNDVDKPRNLVKAVKVE